MRITQTTVTVSATCPNCGTQNQGQVQATGPAGSTVNSVGRGNCGRCGTALVLTGSATMPD
jgi:hypothetical protein